MFDLAELTSGLHGAAQGVLRVEAGPPTTLHCTGWLITDTLVVIPGYLPVGRTAPPGPEVICRQSGNSTPPVRADLVFAPPARDGATVALLRLFSPLPDAAPLRLATREPQFDDVIFVLHYPEGRPNLQMSFGRMLAMDPPWLRHNASTAPGSGGGPVIDSTGAVIAMTAIASQEGYNAGPSLGAILTTLRTAPVWAEISAQHKLVDVASARQYVKDRDHEPGPLPSDDVLLGAAVRWSFDPETLGAGDRGRLAPLVDDPTASSWTLRSGERRQLISAAGAVDTLRAARGDETINDPRQRVIDRILAGPPYDLDEVDEGGLSYWLQAVRWFAAVEPALPSATHVNKVLERRRLRSRLTAIAGPGFRGRGVELYRLGAWYRGKAAGPMVVTGIGGIGKSALVARFATELPLRTLLCWLDFDRADLAPDDADSVLSLLTEQLAVQVEDFAPEPVGDGVSWRERAQAFGAAFARARKSRPAPLLVLDGFEVAQHVKQHGEIWGVLETVMTHVPDLRVIVSGRAHVPGLSLLGHGARSLPLAGIERHEARAWLREHGVTEPQALEKVLEMANGIPLVLRLAVRLVEAGGGISDLPGDLHGAMVEGLLYRRILERVMDPDLGSIAWDSLVLRRVTADVISAVLHDRMPAGLDADEVFERLAQELALVTDQGGAGLGIAAEGRAGELWLRPDVRAATLALLERDDPYRVRTIDERAAAWYAAQDPDVVANVAELVYHRLRLGDTDGAAAAWRDECVTFLRYTGYDLPATGSAWLQQRVTGPRAASAEVAAWEGDALARILSALGRGHDRAVPEILAERSARSTGSRLIFYDAWARWRTGDAVGAAEMLADAGFDDGPNGTDRAVFAALLAAEAGDRPTADRLLAMIHDEGRWRKHRKPAPLQLAVWAARVRLTVDLEAERELDERMQSSDGLALNTALMQVLRPSDLVLRRLLRWMEARNFRRPVPVPRHSSDLPDFQRDVADLRALEATMFEPTDLRVRDAWNDRPDAWRWSDLGPVPEDLQRFHRVSEHHLRVALDLSVLGMRRWRLVTKDVSLGEACELALEPPLADPFTVAIGVTLAAFRSLPLRYPPIYRVDEIVDKMITRDDPVVSRSDPDRVRLATVLLTPKRIREAAMPGHGVLRPRNLREPDERALLLYLLGPDPLRTLFARVAGLPDSEI